MMHGSGIGDQEKDFTSVRCVDMSTSEEGGECQLINTA